MVIQLHTYAQINTSFDRDCIERNSALLAKALIAWYGDNDFEHLLRREVNFIVVASVDSLGYICKVHKINSSKFMADSLKTDITACVISSKNAFFICYQSPYNPQDAERIKTELQSEKKKRFLISLAFPGNLMTLYNYELSQRIKEGGSLSKYEYLKTQMKKMGIE